MARQASGNGAKRLKAKSLRGQGLRLREIADELGVTTTTVWRWLNPDRARAIDERRYEAKKPWQRKKDRSPEGRAACPSCGGLGGIASGRSDRPIAECAGCISDRAAEREQEIQRLWAQPLSMEEIAERLGTTTNSLGAQMARMRRDGVDLPYRRPGWTKRAAA